MTHRKFAACKLKKGIEKTMKIEIPLEIHRQPDEITCGPTCLHAVYQYYGDNFSLEQVISEIPMLDGGGTLAVILGCHALRSGYRARLYSYNLNLFDPTWFKLRPEEIGEKLQEQLHEKDDLKLQIATQAFLEFLELGGELRFEDLSPELIIAYLKYSIPILAGLSATYLYHSARVLPGTETDDDIKGEASGHFVVICGYNEDHKSVLVADPYIPNLVENSHLYEVGMDRLICAILLGILTYDGNLLILEPPE
jgi:hypothetical protein